MVRVDWSREALTSIQRIREYIRQFDPHAAVRMASRLIAAGESLSAFPERGRLAPGGYRELPSIRPYVILYEVIDGVVVVLDVRHGAQAPRED